MWLAYRTPIIGSFDNLHWKGIVECEGTETNVNAFAGLDEIFQALGSGGHTVGCVDPKCHRDQVVCERSERNGEEMSIVINATPQAQLLHASFPRWDLQVFDISNVFDVLFPIHIDWRGNWFGGKHPVVASLFDEDKGQEEQGAAKGEFDPEEESP